MSLSSFPQNCTTEAIKQEVMDVVRQTVEVELESEFVLQLEDRLRELETQFASFITRNSVKNSIKGSSRR